MACTKPPPKRVSTSNFERRKRMTVPPSRRVLRGRLAQLGAAEIAGHAEGGAARALVSFADAAARAHDGAGEYGERSPHGSATRSVNERIAPSFFASTRWLPGGRLRRASPVESVSANAPPAVTVAPCTATLAPSSS